MKKELLLINILFFISLLTSAQTILEGDFRSKQSGNWNDFTTWQVYESGTWRDAVDGEIPGGTFEDDADNVYLEAGITVTLTENATCKALNLNEKEDVIRLNTNDFTLSVFGKIRTYLNEAPGINATSATPADNNNPILLINTGQNGSITFKGNNDKIIIIGGEFSGGKRLAGWNMNIEFAAGKRAISQGTFRAGNITVSSGILYVSPNGAHRPIIDETGIENTIDGTVRIKSGATLYPGRGLHSGGDQFDSLIVEKGGQLLFDHTLLSTSASYPRLCVENIKIEGTFGMVAAKTQVFPINDLGGKTIGEVSHLLIRGDKKQFVNDIIIKDKIEFVDNASIDTASFNLKYQPSASLEYSGTILKTFTTRGTEFPTNNYPKSIIFSNSGNLSMDQNDTIDANLVFNNSKLILADNVSLTLGSNCDTSLAENGYILINETNTITKIIDELTSFPIHMGDVDGNYLPVSFKINSAELLDKSTAFSINFIKSEHPTIADKSVNNLAYILETKTNIPNINYNLKVTYPQSSVIGMEDSIYPYVFKQNLNIVGKVNGVPSHFENVLYLYNLKDDYFITGGDLCLVENNNIESISIPKTCDSSDSITVMADGIPTSVSGSISYNWMYSINDAEWKTTGIKTADFMDAEPFHGGGEYKLQRYAIDSLYCPTAKPKNSNIITFTVVEIVNTIGDNQDITNKEIPQTLNSTTPLSGGNGNYDIQWFSATELVTEKFDSIPDAILEAYNSGLLMDTMYFKRVVKSDICQDTSNTLAINVREDNTSGIFNYKKNASLIKIYPNPASETIYIATNEEVKFIEIITIEGKVCKQITDTKNGINVSDLEKGTYFLKATSLNKGTSSQKFILH